MHERYGRDHRAQALGERLQWSHSRPDAAV